MKSERRAKILLVDDNPRVRSFVHPALEDAGFECVEAVDGLSALEKVDSEFPIYWYWTSCSEMNV